MKNAMMTVSKVAFWAAFFMPLMCSAKSFDKASLLASLSRMTGEEAQLEALLDEPEAEGEAPVLVAPVVSPALPVMSGETDEAPSAVTPDEPGGAAEVVSASEMLNYLAGREDTRAPSEFEGADALAQAGAALQGSSN